MSDEEWGFTAPPFAVEPALVQLRRSLRDLVLAERGNGFELRGKRVLELKAESAAIHARIARKPAAVPEWDTQVLKSAADQRKLLDEVKKRLARWERED